MPSTSRKRGTAFYAPQGRYGFLLARGLWHLLNERRAGSAKNGIVPVWLGLVADIKFFGRHQGGSICFCAGLVSGDAAASAHNWPMRRIRNSVSKSASIDWQRNGPSR